LLRLLRVRLADPALAWTSVGVPDGGPSMPLTGWSTAAVLFQLVFLLAAPFWALMIVAPTWSWTRRIVGSPLIVVPPVLGYAILVFSHLTVVLPAVARLTLAGAQELLATPDGAAAGWAHFIAFDLFVGRWIYLDSRRAGRHPLLMAPVLVLTILLGPLGLLVYLAIRFTGPAGSLTNAAFPVQPKCWPPGGYREESADGAAAGATGR
jgi:hypothetical protein